MKLRIPPRSLPCCTNHYRPFPSHTLHIRHRHSLLLCNPYLPRRQLRLSPTLPPCQRSLHILYLPVPTRRTRNLLRLLYILRNMKHRNYPPLRRHSHSIYRLRTSMRPNILLRSNSHHKPPLSHSLCRNNPSRMSLRRVLSRQGHTHPILRPTFPTTLHYLSHSRSPSTFPPRNRLKQPNRNPIRRRYNPIPPLLHH